MTDREACIALNTISGIGYVRFSALEKMFDGIGNACGRSCRDYSAVPGINMTLAETLALNNWQQLCGRELEETASANVRIITLFDEDYPPVLFQLSNPPLCLYVRGTLPRFPDRSIAVVGSRRMSRYGETMTKRITSGAVSRGYVVVSGLANGIDTVAHRTTLECGGATVAVLGGGLMHVHPQENLLLAQQIVDSGGAVISEFPMNFPVSRTSFPRRNRIVACLTQATAVIEAGVKSGAIITARLALECGREVFAVPGQATNEQAQGCHQLIREGAFLTETFEDIASRLEQCYQPELVQDTLFDAPSLYQKSEIPGLEPELAELYTLIPGTGISIEELAVKSGKPIADLSSMLMRLEFKFLINCGPDLLYRPEK